MLALLFRRPEEHEGASLRASWLLLGRAAPAAVDARAAELLVREVGPDDRGDVAALLAGADWPLLEDEAWTDGWPGLVLYDPADGVTRGVIVAREVTAGTFELVAWAVNGGPDRAAMAERLVRAVADRLRVGDVVWEEREVSAGYPPPG